MPRKLTLVGALAALVLGFAPRAVLGELALADSYRTATQIAAPRKDHSGQIPPERLQEIAEQVRPRGWTLNTYDVGDGETSWKWTVYVLRHEDGTLWQQFFPHRLYYQVRRILEPAWVPIESYETDALLLAKRESLHGTGWRARYVLTPTATFPEITYTLRYETIKYRHTPYESEFRFWLANGPESVWGPDRPFPNLPPPAPATVSPDQIFEP